MADPLYDRYFIDTQTLGGLVKESDLYGDQHFKNVVFHISTFAEAFKLALTEPYLKEGIENAMPAGITAMAYEIARACYIQFVVTAVAAGVLATVGGLAGSVTLPVVGTVVGAEAGAELGAAIAGWMLFGIGLPEMVASAKYLIVTGEKDLQTAFDEAMKGNKEGSARSIAQFFGQVLSYVAPLIILALMAKGAKVAGGSFAKLGSVKAWINAIKWLEINDMKVPTRELGMSADEIKGIAAMSRRKIIVIRGCNPLRLKYIEEGYHAKPVYEKWHTAHDGPYPGQVCLTDDERLTILGQGYRITAVPKGKFGLHHLYEIEHPTKPQAPLNGHYLEEYAPRDVHNALPAAERSVLRYRIVHPDGKGFVGDMDRVAYAEYDGGTGVLKPGKFGAHSHWKDNDDPREIAFMNGQLRKFAGKTINYNPFQHGNASNFLAPDPHNPGAVMPGWPARDPLTHDFDFNKKEPLLVAIDGRSFVLDWEMFGSFCDLFQEFSNLFPWSK